MAPVTAHLIALSPSSDAKSFEHALKTFRSQANGSSLLWAGYCHHWIHEPQLSRPALTGIGSILKQWDFVLVTDQTIPNAQGLPVALLNLVSDHWSITFDAADELINGVEDSMRDVISKSPPALPAGWSPEDLSGLRKSAPPADLVTSLGTRSPVFGKDKSASLMDLKTFVESHVLENPGPIFMFNLLSFFPNQQAQYLNYVSAFVQEIGPKYGARPVIYGFGVSGWTSRPEDAADPGVWENVAVIGYPSLLHFAKMLDDARYAELDRAYKGGVVRDNPLICCTTVDFTA
ncbi:hypothetical protein PFICI_13346 [Pestalotiopsis fici W106-1]|uniref:DUF1330 domain-containing protein n=1 Tax=Pestalotiopsis fici (strain W106-1 / CGMCC3.15140) TaxID=1229662 RepID=W3WP09_PESFW|nr:uncharacterized protein PFICI_13346 [Pestalotiopsis fici W106-1]ETS74862.1 hypothetical protein PFICI_13346 [Pestalotiopsis fici W106-1]